MKIILVALALTCLFAIPTAGQSYGPGEPSGGSPSAPNRQFGPRDNPAQQFGTDDQKSWPNAACLPNSANPQCREAQIADARPPNPGSAAVPSPAPTAPLAGAGSNTPTAPPGVSGYQGGASGIPTDCPPGSVRPDCQQATVPEPSGSTPDNPSAVHPGTSGKPVTGGGGPQ